MSQGRLWVARCLAALLACVLLYSGTIHAMQPFLHLYSVAKYNIVPHAIAVSLAAVIPYFQIVLGMCLVVRVAERVALQFSAMTFLLFASAQSLAIAQDREISCGCFGFSEVTISAWSLVVPYACAVACVATLMLEGRTMPSAGNRAGVAPPVA